MDARCSAALAGLAAGDDSAWARVADILAVRRPPRCVGPFAWALLAQHVRRGAPMDALRSSVALQACGALQALQDAIDTDAANVDRLLVSVATVLADSGCADASRSVCELVCRRLGMEVTGQFAETLPVLEKGDAAAIATLHVLWMRSGPSRVAELIGHAQGPLFWLPAARSSRLVDAFCYALRHSAGVDVSALCTFYDRLAGGSTEMNSTQAPMGSDSNATSRHLDLNSSEIALTVEAHRWKHVCALFARGDVTSAASLRRATFVHLECAGEVLLKLDALSADARIAFAKAVGDRLSALERLILLHEPLQTISPTYCSASLEGPLAKHVFRAVSALASVRASAGAIEALMQAYVCVSEARDPASLSAMDLLVRAALSADMPREKYWPIVIRLAALARRTEGDAVRRSVPRAAALVRSLLGRGDYASALVLNDVLNGACMRWAAAILCLASSSPGDVDFCFACGPHERCDAQSGTCALVGIYTPTDCPGGASDHSVLSDCTSQVQCAPSDRDTERHTVRLSVDAILNGLNDVAAQPVDGVTLSRRSMLALLDRLYAHGSVRVLRTGLLLSLLPAGASVWDDRLAAHSTGGVPLALIHALLAGRLESWPPGAPAPDDACADLVQAALVLRGAVTGTGVDALLASRIFDPRTQKICAGPLVPEALVQSMELFRQGQTNAAWEAAHACLRAMPANAPCVSARAAHLVAHAWAVRVACVSGRGALAAWCVESGKRYAAAYGGSGERWRAVLAGVAGPHVPEGDYEALLMYAPASTLCLYADCALLSAFSGARARPSDRVTTAATEASVNTVDLPCSPKKAIPTASVGGTGAAIDSTSVRHADTVPIGGTSVQTICGEEALDLLVHVHTARTAEMHGPDRRALAGADVRARLREHDVLTVHCANGAVYVGRSAGPVQRIAAVYLGDAVLGRIASSWERLHADIRGHLFPPAEVKDEGARRAWWDARRGHEARMAAAVDVLEAAVVRPALAALGVRPAADDPFGPPGGRALVLSVCSRLHAFPWEAVPSLRSRPVVRLLAFSAGPSANRMTEGAHSYAVINPGGDLAATEEKLVPVISEKLAPVTICTSASEAGERLLAWLSAGRTYVYAGHGGGERLVPPARLSALRAAPCPSLLLGCASGRLHLRRAPLDLVAPGGRRLPDAVLPGLLRAGCPAAAAVLWDVTDRDLDGVSAALLAAVADAAGRLDSRAAGALRAAREMCVLPLANGAAVVLFVSL